MRIGFATSLVVDGVEYKIDSDFRTALDIMRMYNDKAISPLLKHMCMLEMLYCYYDEDLDEVVVNVPNDVEKAMYEAFCFLNYEDEIDISEESDDVSHLSEEEQLLQEEDKPRSENRKLIDFDKDYKMLFSAINKVYGGIDIRGEDFVHWHTFLGYCQELNENSPIVFLSDLRRKLYDGEKLEDHEKRFYRKNKKLVEQSMNFISEQRGEFDDFFENESKRVTELEEISTEDLLDREETLSSQMSIEEFKELMSSK